MASISDELMGDVWPAARPGPDGADYGSSVFDGAGPYPVRSFQTFTLVYTVGQFGLDDTGAIKIVHRWTDDGGPVQTHDPAAMNYVTAVASNGVDLDLFVEPHPHQRPWYNGLRITVSRGHMAPGDTITVVYGDRSGGGPGLRLQTFCEGAYAFRVLADVCATGTFLPVAEHAVAIGPGPAVRWVLVAPTLRRVGEPFDLGIRAEDAWGNATDQSVGGLSVRADAQVRGVPAEVTYAPGARAARLSGLSAAQPGTYRFALLGPDGGTLATSNPMVVKEDGPVGYWGDLHGQSGETVGIDPITDYLAFARDIAFLDVTSHQANDFQVTGAFWAHLNAVTAEIDDPGHFVVFPGYEWSGNTPVGGDHNVFFASEGRPIVRSSHALLEDRSDIETDAHSLPELFAALQGEDAVIYAHVGGGPRISPTPRTRGCAPPSRCIRIGARSNGSWATPSIWAIASASSATPTGTRAHLGLAIRAPPNSGPIAG